MKHVSDWHDIQFTVEVELEPVCVDVVERYIELRRYVLHDAAEPTGYEEDLHVALVKPVHKFPG